MSDATTPGAVRSPAMTSIIGMICGGFDQCMPTTRPGTRVPAWMCGDRDPGGVGGKNAIVGHLHLDLAKNLNLEFKVLGHCLDDEIGARDRVRQTVVD